MKLVRDDDFHKLIAKRAQTLLGLAKHLTECKSTKEIKLRPLMGALLSQSAQLEELLDAYGAGKNCKWCPLRSLIAAIKHFSDLSYELLHILYSLPAYRLLPIDHDFVKATEETLEFTVGILIHTAELILAKAYELDLPIPAERLREKSYREELPEGQLPSDCQTRKIETVSETVTLLTTAFLNLAVESKNVRAAGRAKPEQYESFISDSVREEKLRSLELRFHNLQSLYDTHVSGTEAEHLDTDLPILRGHISVVFHLLKTATLFVHHYERHVMRQKCDSITRLKPMVRSDELLEVLMKYSVAHISIYISCAEHLCHDMIARYSEVGRIEVPVPPYRGFHVRPSTLVSKLILHYGSAVQMEMVDQTYDASSPLELFRANEKINAQKRKKLAYEIVQMKLVPEWASGKDIKIVVKDVILTLTEQNKLILYEQPLQVPEELVDQETTLLEKVTARVFQLLALGKIDIPTDLMVVFIGDKRVLEDIRVLAESGYGEDNFGNNIPLPEKLSYLRH